MPLRPYISLVGGFAKYLCKVHSSSCHVTGLDRFLQLLADEKRRGQGKGILTYANHISVMDDPGVFGALPMWAFQRPETTRWTLGATDIMFTNPVFSSLFHAGQVIPTDRGRGIFQPALDTAIDKLEQGQWVHLFPEGYVNLSRKMVLRRFKWGMSRLLLESKERPRVVPIWIQGFDQVMPDPRRFPKFLPRPFANLSINFGEPIDQPGSSLDFLLTELRSKRSLNPLFWEKSQHEQRLRGHGDLGTSATNQAPVIPIPSPSSFPVLDPPVPRPANGWPAPPPNSRAAGAQEATFGTLSESPSAVDKSLAEEAMEARSRLVELLRRELAFLGVRSRRAMGQDDGDVGDLVHTLMPWEEGSDTS